jgi:MoaA/NifB/PqqE/SkfB family radical SAM enzyme
MIPFTTTNGVAVKPEILLKLDKSGLCALNFSVHGVGKDHDAAVGIPGAYEGLLEAAKFCTSKTKIICIANHVLTNESVRCGWYDRIWDIMRPIGFRAFNILPICVNSPDTSVLLNPEGVNVLDQLAAQSHILMDTKNYSKPLCPAALEDLFVNNFGQVQPCPFIPISFGNVRDEPLKEIFLRMQQHEMFKKRRSVCMPARDKDFIAKYILPAFEHEKLPVPIGNLGNDK